MTGLFGRATPCVVLLAACSFDRGDRWLARAVDEPATAACEVGERRCGTGGVEVCDDDAGTPGWSLSERCNDSKPVCAPGRVECTACLPGAGRCDAAVAERCKSDGSGYEAVRECDAARGQVCRSGACSDLCAAARQTKSNVGCEYWAVDLDNANVNASLNAAAQQFAVVVSNPQPDIVATVTVEQDDSAPGSANTPVTVATVTIAAFALSVLKLGPREVDGSPTGQFDRGSHTAVTRAAYRIRSSVPVVAYQFNPLENVNVFSNDASLLKPVEAIPTPPDGLEPAYVAVGWPQTIASTDDPDTNFSATNPTDYRSFLTIVGTRAATRVRVQTRAAVLGGGPIAGADAGDTVEFTVDPFDVVNLETDDFGADFTGSVIEADGPVVVFSGSEAADAPFFDKLGDRRCCADHLEEQLDPIRTAGKRFVASVSPNRSEAIVRAGGALGVVSSPEFFRVVAATPAGADIVTTLEGSRRIRLEGLGDFAEITSEHDFFLESTEPIVLASVSASQAAAGIPSGQPGGDPSFLVIPPIEQYRTGYVFLTPDRYSFDFVRVAAPADTEILLDGVDLTERPGCIERSLSPDGETDPVGFSVIECQLSFPELDTSLEAEQLVLPGRQDDGVHEIVATRKVGVIVDGFDRNVSYAYAAGTELTEIVPR